MTMLLLAKRSSVVLEMHLAPASERPHVDHLDERAPLRCRLREQLGVLTQGETAGDLETAQ